MSQADATKAQNPPTRKPLTQERLKEVLRYDPETGIFSWFLSTARRIKIGDVAGCINPTDHYVYIRIDGNLYAAHRLVFLYMDGEWPPDEIDHINGVRHQNQRITLRHATRQQNSFNRDVGANVAFHKCGKWQARVKIKGRTKSLGYYWTRADAERAYWAHISETRGDFAREK